MSLGIVREVIVRMFRWKRVIDDNQEVKTIPIL